MRYWLLAMATAVMLSSPVVASTRMASRDSNDASVTRVGTTPGRLPRAGMTIQVAMGPTSAAHKPGGTGEPTKDAPKHHKKARH
jgi:hypothetical protein